MFSLSVFLLLLQSVFRITLSEQFWPDYENIEGMKSFYKIHTIPKTWHDAKIVCEREGALLFRPENDEEAQAVISHWENKEPFIHWVFLGIFKISDNTFMNSDDGSLNDLQKYWNSGEPNNIGGKEYCVTMNNDGKFNDEDCNNKYPFICKAKNVNWNKSCGVPYAEYKYNNKLKKCYKLHTSRMNWTEAYTTCNAERSYLAVINSKEERRYLVDLIKSHETKDNERNPFSDAVHLGFYKRDSWITIKGDLLHESEYKEWSPSQPDGGINENCGSMSFSGTLNDVACYQDMNFICEHDVTIRRQDVGLRKSYDSKFRDDYRLMGTNYYKYHPLHVPWNEAKGICEKESATLFYPVDSTEVSTVIEYWNKTHPTFDYIFIGIANWIVKDVLDTIDGVSLDRIYDDWNYGEPNNAGGGDGCVVLQRDGSLKDDDCNLKYPFICKRPRGITQWNEDCNIPYVNYMKESNNKCYKFHLTPKNWTEAKAVCAGEESSLAVINSKQERDYLVDLTAKAPKDHVKGDYLRGAVHLGFYKSENDGWMTVDGVTVHDSGYNTWAYDQPDGVGIENCGSMLYNGQLNDIACYQKMFFICEHNIRRI